MRFMPVSFGGPMVARSEVEDKKSCTSEQKRGKMNLWPSQTFLIDNMIFSLLLDAYLRGKEGLYF